MGVWGAVRFGDKTLRGVGEDMEDEKRAAQSPLPTGSVHLSRRAPPRHRGGGGRWSRDQGGVGRGQGQGDQRTGYGVEDVRD